MKNNLKISIFSFLSVFCVLSLSVCSNDGNNEYRTGWAKGRSIPYTFSPDYIEDNWGGGFPEPYEFFEDDDYLWWFDEYKESMYVITSMEELYKTIEENKGTQFSYYFENLPSKYDESFFSENILICWYIMEYTTPTNNRIYSLNVNGKTLTVNLLRAEPGPLRSIGLEFYEIQVKKADIAGVTNVEKVTRCVTNPPKVIAVYVIEEYYDKKLTLNDFGKEYFSGISGETKIEDYKYRSFGLILKTLGLKSAKAAKKHLETLYFIREARISY